MKTSPYFLNGDVPELLKGDGKDVKGLRFDFAEAETLDDVREQVTDDASIVKAAQSAIDISKQRIARSAANGEEVEKVLKNDDLTDDEKREQAQAIIAERLQSYKFGARATPVAGGAKQAVSTVKNLQAAAQNDPELAAKLAALGISL